MNDFWLVFVCLMAIVMCSAMMMNLIDRIVETIPVREVTDKPLPPKYIVKELTNCD